MDDYWDREYLIEEPPADTVAILMDKILSIDEVQARSIMLNPITEIYLDGEDLEALRERLNVQFDNEMRERNRTEYIKSINELSEEQLERLRMDIWNALQKELADVICQEAYIPYYKPGTFEPNPDFDPSTSNTKNIGDELLRLKMMFEPEPIDKNLDDFVEDDVSWIRKRMKHCTNPMERKQLEKRLNMIFKRRKGKKR